MIKILIVDDEKIVLNGLKKIIDWEGLGIQVCDTANDGQEALTKILEYQPEIVLIDISMPTLSGLEVIKLARKMKFIGHFIILSGYTKFEYARQAMKFDVKHYLTKPIDSENLKTILKEIIDKDLDYKKKENNLYLLEKNHREQIIENLLVNDISLSIEAIKQFKLEEGPFQIAIWKTNSPKSLNDDISFSQLLGVNNIDYDFFEEVTINENSVFLLKKQSSQLLLDFYHSNYRHFNIKDSFLSIGKKVSSLSDLVKSYEDALNILQHHFFLPSTINIATSKDISKLTAGCETINIEYQSLQKDIFRSILLKNNDKIEYSILSLKMKLLFSEMTIDEIRYALIDFYLSIKHQISNKFPTIAIPILDNPQIIYFINNHTHLEIILSLIRAQFQIMSNTIGTTTNQTTIDNITFYIQQNYQHNLTLELLAEEFNYNASYLGKLFTKSVGLNFNHYLDQVRINQAKVILQNSELKIYEVASQVGYKSVDYFYKKFRLFENESPATYKKRHSKK